MFWGGFFYFLKQVAALWTVPGTSLQMHLLIFPLFLPEGKAGSILFGLWVRSFFCCFTFSDVSHFILFCFTLFGLDLGSTQNILGVLQT